MEHNREKIVIEIQGIIKDLKANNGWWENRGRGGWFNHEILADALALITSQEQRIGAQDMTISELRKRAEKAEHDADRYAQRIKELTEENKKIGIENFDLICELSRIKADTVSELQTRFAMHYGTYTDKDMTPITEVFRILDQIAKRCWRAYER